MSAALQGIRVLDMSRVLAGPWAGQLLGDYGADVVKIERPEHGDDTRHWGPPWLDGAQGGESAYFLSANRNKRSVSIDLSGEAGQTLVRELAGAADVLIENFRVGYMQRFGLGPDTLLSANPRLIYCSISAYGQTGERAGEPGYDAMIQASAGLMSITGPVEGAGPQKVGVAIADIMAGMYAVTAVLAALNARHESGQGQHIDVPLYDAQVAMLANQNMNFLVGNQVPGRMGTAHPNLVPYQVFASSDGDIMIAVGNDRQFRSLCALLEMQEVGADPRFATGAARVENRAALIPLLEAKLIERSTSDWQARLIDAGVPCGPVNDIGQVLTDRHASERQLVRSLQNGVGQSVPTVSNPVSFGTTPVQYRSAPPLLGEHNDEVLQEWLGYSGDRIQSLRENRTI